MASTPLRTYGNTLSDLQAGTNAAQAITYQRQNAEDETSQRRLEAFLRLRGEQLKTEAQQKETAANRAQRMAEMLQQNNQFTTSEGNRVKLGELGAKTQLEVAKATAEGRGMDPRAFQTIVEADQYNKEGQARVVEANRLSQARKDLLAEIKAAKANGYFWNDSEYGAFKQRAGREPDLKAATDALIQIDGRAKALNLSPMDDGGFYVPPFVPIQIPNTGRTVIPVEPQGARVPAMLNPAQGGEVTIGGVPLNGFIDSSPVAPATSGVRPVLRWDGNNWIQ